jgi:hypothetical protein
VSDDPTTIHLGARTHTLVPQGIGRIRRKLAKLIQLNESPDQIDGEIGTQLYDVLQTFIPDVASLPDLLGEQEDEAAALQTEATLPQLLDAIEAVYRVNGADRLVRLGKSLLGAEGLQTIVQREALTFSLDRSLSSPSTNDGADSTTSSTTPPTSVSSEDSPSPDSSPSSTPESIAA